LKLKAVLFLTEQHASHPAGVRGLKPTFHPPVGAGNMSHPAGVRGLKQNTAQGIKKCRCRTPQGCVD